MKKFVLSACILIFLIFIGFSTNELICAFTGGEGGNRTCFKPCCTHLDHKYHCKYEIRQCLICCDCKCDCSPESGDPPVDQEIGRFNQEYEGCRFMGYTYYGQTSEVCNGYADQLDGIECCIYFSCEDMFSTSQCRDENSGCDCEIQCDAHNY